MKKLLALLLVVATAITLVGCVPDFSGTGKTPSRGVIDGNVYTNDFLGFKFTKPASWVYSTDEEIAAAMNLTVENFLGEKFKEALENNPAIYDMMVVDSITRTNINIIYENLKKSFASNITVEQYIETLKSQLSGVSGMTVTFPDELETAKLGDVEFTKCVCTTTAYGVRMTQVYYIHKVSGYMVSIVATIVNGYTVSDIEAMFNNI